jgi:hypothetical protein
MRLFTATTAHKTPKRATRSFTSRVDALLSRKVYRLLNERREREPRPQARFDFARRAAELDGAHDDPPLHSPIEWVFAQARESRGCDGPKLFRLRLH